MGERLLCKQEVIGSNPFTSTTGAGTAPVTGREHAGGVGRRSEKIARQRRGLPRRG